MHELYAARKQILVYTIIFLATFCMAFSVFIAGLQQYVQTLRQDTTIANELYIKTADLSSEITLRISDISYLSDMYTLKSETDSSNAHLKQHWIVFSNHARIYPSITLLDTQAHETVRVFYNPAEHAAAAISPISTPLTNTPSLQTALTLEKGQVAISTLFHHNDTDDSVIYLSTPAYGKTGQKEGTIILEYPISHALNKFRHTSLQNTVQFMLIDTRGHWIYNPQTVFSPQNKTFSELYPHEWESLQKPGQGDFHTDTRHYIFRRIAPVDTSSIHITSLLWENGGWIVLAVLHDEDMKDTIFSIPFCKSVRDIMWQNLDIYAWFFPLALLLAVLITLLKSSHKKFKYYSQFDPLTGIFNRRGGFKKLRSSYATAEMTGQKLSVCFADIDNLKHINDSSGHDAGDRLIINVVTVMKNNIRQSDFIIRLGGDEFLIVFPHTSAPNAEIIWTRIEKDYQELNERSDDSNFPISVSHGIIEFTLQKGECIDDVIRRADQRMYETKAQNKAH